MDIQKTIKEIGLFETALNLSKYSTSAEIIDKAGAAMPLPDSDITERVKLIAKWLHSFGKTHYMFLTPEIALVDALVELTGSDIEIIFAVPHNLDDDINGRLKNNLPRNVKASLLKEPEFLRLYPEDGLMVICGYSGASRAMVLSDTYRMAEHYSSFRGKKVFLPYLELEKAARFDGWMELKQEKITMQWRLK